TSAVLVLSISGVRPAAAPAQSTARPCTTPAAVCTEFVALGGGPGRSKIYRSYPLGTRNDAIRRALIMVHGTNRNADHYFETSVAAAFIAGALEDTIVIAPHMIDRRDPAAENEIVWETSWRTGGPSQSHPTLTSFDFIDEVLRKLATKSVFPNMRAIVVAGHSAGGQFANRYGMSNKIHDTIGVPVSYVVANPSSYAWPDPIRPLPTGDADPATAKEGWNQRDETPLPPHTNYTFGPFDATKAPNFNRWPAGFENRTGYNASISDAQLKKQLIERPTTYLLGQVDTLPLGGFDSSPNAMAQGPTRRARGEAYYKYVTETLGAKHKILIVSECGHNNRCMYTTNDVFPYVFPKVN
ncbi:MAG TPA: alpha/beta hydrolase, partial [Vicinamibacterales bacterium]|nr:alpha/beta hydrolase [Vicinamibacterales bacterium]